MITIGELQVGDDPAAWRTVGFTVEGDLCRIGTVGIRLARGGEGITKWTLRGAADTPVSIDGIATSASAVPPSEPTSHANGTTRIDHLVLMTPDLPRTTAALETVGLEVRRERDAGAFRQVFFRLGEVILELVGPHEAGAGDAALWGLTFAVDDLDATAEFLGDRIGRVKDAVQPGRRIATLRGKAIGISPAVAFMSEKETGNPG